MKFDIQHQTIDANEYRSARVKSLFNADRGDTVRVRAELPIEGVDWKLGLIVGPSGTGKTTLGKAVLGPDAYRGPESMTWPTGRAIVDAISPDKSFEDVTGALAAVGLGTVPAWLRPYHVLSTGERFRADLARVVCEAPPRVVIDEFTSVVDRQIAQVGAMAFAKAWRRTGGQAVALSCHYDIVDWLQPDWVFDTGTGFFRLGGGNPRPRIKVEVRKVDWSWWPMFHEHHYLNVGPMPAASAYVGFVNGEPVAHLGISSKNAGGNNPALKRVEARGCRLVVMPEWQGAGVGMAFLNAVAEMQLNGHPHAHLKGRHLTTLFHTSHPGLCAALRRSPKWVQISAALYGGETRHKQIDQGVTLGAQGGHFRAIQGFRYVGDKSWKAAS